MKQIIQYIQKKYEFVDGIYVEKNNPYSNTYWSNLKKADQSKLIELIRKANNTNFKNEIINQFPQYKGYMFDEKRTKGIELLDIQPNEIGADLGCMWGNILTYIAKRCSVAVGFDKTFEHLLFLKERLIKEDIKNVILINKNLQIDFELNNIFDFAIVNGVLEWIPVKSDIEIDRKYKVRESDVIYDSDSPRDIQIRFLKNVFNALKENGKLYLAIENRWDYQYFLWKKDPHTNLFFTAFLPRKISNFISKIFTGKPYVTYIYSLKELKKLLNQVGFSEIIAYAVFPNYKYPTIIVPIKSNERISLKNIYNYKKTKSFFKITFRQLRKFLDFIIYEKLKLYTLAPSFIVIAKKNNKNI